MSSNSEAAATASVPAPTRDRLRELIIAHRRDFILGSIILAFSTAAAASIPQFIRGASNDIMAEHARHGMIMAAGIMIAAVFGAACRVGSRIYLFNAGRDIEYELRHDLLVHLHTLGPSFYRHMSAGEVMSRATNDLGQVRLMVGFAALNIVNAVISYAVNIPLMVARSPMLTLASLAPYPLIVLATRGFAGSLFRRSRATQDAIGAMSERAQQSLAGVRVVRAYGLEEAEAKEFDRLSHAALDANLALVRIRNAMTPILGIASAAASLIVLWLGGRYVVEGRITVGDILAFQGHLALVAWPTIAMGYVFSITQRGRASLARIGEVLDAQPDMASTGGEALGTVNGALSVKNLSYLIGDRTLLENVTFDVPAGGTLAIVGKTGSGKSTLAALLTRMLPTPDGTVFLDGHDVTHVPLRELRASVCLAQQEPFLFSTTVARNIAFALAETDGPEAWKRARDAAKEAQILEEAESMPEGFDTIVGERGVQLSGGQRQRVALARALLAAPRVLVLDDPLSAVDSRTERAILDAIERAAKGRTLVLVTHRIAAASRCAQIVVLDEGKLLESGTHAQLMESGGVYQRLAERQALEAELESIA